MKTFTEQYQGLVNDATKKILSIIEEYGTESEFVNDKCINLLDINQFNGFNEITNINGNLTFLNNDGYHFGAESIGDSCEFFTLVDDVISHYRNINP